MGVVNGHGLPSSSMRTREWCVACVRIVTVSRNSTKKVLSPRVILSDAPILVNTLSTGLSRQLVAGTKQPCNERQTNICTQQLYSTGVTVQQVCSHW